MKDGVPVVSPVALSPGEVMTACVVVTVPGIETAYGLSETTTITATSSADPSLARSAQNVTRVWRSVLLPLAIGRR